MKYTALILCLSLLMTSAKANNIRLYGQLAGMNSNKVIMKYDGAVSKIGGTRDIVITTDVNGNFDTTFIFEEPAYYTLGFNKLYLSPGDNMKMYVSLNPDDALFEGKGAEANTYLKGAPSPKSGSFLDAGRIINVQESFDKTALLINKLAEARKRELNVLKAVFEPFKELETARISLDVVNSYFLYPLYFNAFKKLPPAEADALARKLLSDNAAEIAATIAEFSGDKYLDLFVARELFSFQKSDLYKECFSGVPIGERRQELDSAAKLVMDLHGNVTSEMIREYTAKAASFKNKDFRIEAEAAIRKAAVLLSGKPAFDFVMVTPEGTESKLSDFKGKLLYLDFWATWCTPCIAESPYFKELANKYKGRNIEFIQISIDYSVEAWKGYLEKKKDSTLTQYHSTDRNLTENWAIKGIPRFILIDSSFNIINAYAERPSSSKIEGIIDAYLQNPRQ